MKPECLVCLTNQALRVARAIDCDDACAEAIVKLAAHEVAEYKLNQTPPQAAARLYPKISTLVGKEDLYEAKKIESTNKAFEFLDFVYEKIDEAPCKIEAALRAAVAGNVIDFATEVSFAVEEEIAKVFEARFAIDEKREFVDRLKEAKTFMLIGDNVGEHVFDKVLLEVIEEYYPQMEKYYVVRGKPIINDVTATEAAAIGIDTLASIVDSGLDTPGFLLERANEKTKRLFKSADVILAKGMGNFECMDALRDGRIFHLFKVKCSVVSQRVGADIGSLVCINNANIKEVQ
jgi:uncharacterized protein with ATP-grasp and redox domains